MMYTNKFIEEFVKNTAYYAKNQSQLYIQATLTILLLPVAALVMCAIVCV
jgi:hypothetical protein